MIIICYMGGTAGDLVTAVIDSKDTLLDDKKLLIHPNRSKLKKPHLFNNSKETSEYINSLSSTYMSLPSHSTDFHIQENQDFIGIIVDDYETALWAATRFKELHLPHVWEEVMKFSNISTVEEYAELMMKYATILKNHTDKIITLKQILNGELITELKKYVDIELQEQLYKDWLSNR